MTDARWLNRQLAELTGSSGTVLWFATIDCPLVRRYLPRVQQLAVGYQDRGVRFLLVNVGPEDGLVEAAAQQVEHAPATTFVKDFDGALSRAVGVDRTVTAVVLDAGRRVVYRGRVDDQYRYAGALPEVGREDLRQALAGHAQPLLGQVGLKFFAGGFGAHCGNVGPPGLDCQKQSGTVCRCGP